MFFFATVPVTSAGWVRLALAQCALIIHQQARRRRFDVCKIAAWDIQSLHKFGAYPFFSLGCF